MEHTPKEREPDSTKVAVEPDYPSEVDEPFRTLIQNEAEKSLYLYKRISIGFAIFVCLAMGAVVAISIVLASNSKKCDDFTDAEKALINAVIHTPYQPNTWQKITPAVAPPARLSHSSVSVADKYVFIYGGIIGSLTEPLPYSTYSDMWRYTSSTQSWDQVLQVGNLPGGRLHASLVARDDNNLLMFGGFNVFNTVAGHDSYATFYQFTINTNTWTQLDTSIAGPAPSKRGAHGAAWINGAMYMFGGFPKILATGHIQELWKFTWATMTWTNMTINAAQAPEGRIGFNFIFLDPNTAIITAGGCSTAVNPLGQCDTTWTYDVPSNTWTAIVSGGTPFARRASGSDAAVGGVIYTFGGVWLNVTQFKMFNDLNAFDTVTQNWIPMYPNYGRGVAPSPTFGHSASRLGRKIVIFGGRINTIQQRGTNQTWEYTCITPVA